MRTIQSHLPLRGTAARGVLHPAPRPALRWAGLALLMCVPALALAHHSFAMFDMNKDLTVQGTVVQFQWESPHSWLDLMVGAQGGPPIRWSLEMGAPNALYRRGWRQASLKPGDKVSARVHPLRDGRRGGSLISVTLPDGSQLLGSGGSASPAAAPVAP